jgi:hypothetical protein
LKDALGLAEILGALSLTTDLGAGVLFEKGLRTQFAYARQRSGARCAGPACGDARVRLSRPVEN